MSRWLIASFVTEDEEGGNGPIAEGTYLSCEYEIIFRDNIINLTVPQGSLTEKLVEEAENAEPNTYFYFDIGDEFSRIDIYPQPTAANYFEKNYIYLRTFYIDNRKRKLNYYNYEEIIKDFVDKLISNGYMKNIYLYDESKYEEGYREDLKKLWVNNEGKWIWRNYKEYIESGNRGIAYDNLIDCLIETTNPISQKFLEEKLGITKERAKQYKEMKQKREQGQDVTEELELLNKEEK